MQYFKVTIWYHADDKARQAGDVITQLMPFKNLDEGIAFCESINARCGSLTYHYTGIVQDSQNFCMFDLSVVREQVPGSDNLPWNEVQVAA